jgi:endoglucanase
MAAHRPHRASPLVLVASPDPELMNRTCARIRRTGLAVCCAHSAAGCLRVATAVGPDIVLIDARLPRRLAAMLRTHPATRHAEILQIPASGGGGGPNSSVAALRTLLAIGAIALMCVFLACAPRPAPQPTPIPEPTPTPAPSPTPVPTATPIPFGTGPLQTSGGALVDAGGHPVRLTGVNWSGMETSNFAPIGLDSRNLEDMLDQVVSSGFNTLRLPFSDQLLDSAAPTGINFGLNPELQGLTGLQLMDRIVDDASLRGLRVVLDRHRPTADSQSEFWYSQQVPESRWIQDWVMLASRYRGNAALIGADLANEPHGAATWGDDNPRTDWRLAAERAGNAILATNPDWLIIVEGVQRVGSDTYWWGGNLSAAESAPVRLSNPQRLVYSAHDYGPEESGQTWLRPPEFPGNLSEVWRTHWAYLQQDGVAPVLVGEFGGRSIGGDPEGIWQRTLIDFLTAGGFSYTYWVWNPDGWVGGLLLDGHGNVDQAKLSLLSPSQAELLGRPARSNRAER